MNNKTETACDKRMQFQCGLSLVSCQNDATDRIAMLGSDVAVRIVHVGAVMQVNVVVIGTYVTIRLHA